ncbi:histidine kinase [Lutibacter sp.]|uniref:sensor histidine kinase n=1 Tax=Lutibacter sp. TaxID=1925666 RepID=UPI0025BFA247|nr:histidine kinase [Lutibacter sp.]MCF6168252.1 histidine kinase [Lutibacter sp.]
MNLIQLNKTKFIAVHFLFWVIVWFFFVYFFSYNSNNTGYVTWFSSFLLPVTMATTYFVVYYLIPTYLLPKKYKLFVLYSVYTLVFSTYLILMTMLGCFVFLSNLNIVNMPPMSRNYIFILILVYLVVGIVSFVSLLNHNFKTISKNKELQNKILATQLQIKNQELKYLKKQLHPHFLFNTLNTIYGFALKQSKDTPEIILKLSNLLDYILYQVSKPKVSLKEEVLHIKEYIELEKIRFQDTLKISFHSNEIPDSVLVSPMLLIPFVENAFKHGNLIDGFLTVEINVKLNKNQLAFFIKNTVLNTEINQSEVGIGLKNIQKRLDLLYKNNYQLQIENKDNWFQVNFKILNINSSNNG